MALILFSFVVRVRDGLPLSASTDFQHSAELQQRKQQLRLLSKQLHRYPERGTLHGEELHIYFLSSGGVGYMAVCSCELPVALAFCFLQDVRWEFSTRYPDASVAIATRPYPFLEFDSSIQKLKQHYNKSGCPSMGVTLAEVTDELRSSPPHTITLDDLQSSNGAANGHAEQAAATGPSQRLEPVSAPGILSLVLNIMCAALNLIRGVHLMEYTLQDDYDGIWNVVAFLVAFLCCVCQCQLYLFHCCYRRLKASVLLCIVVICNLFLFGLRNQWQLSFHVGVAILSTALTVTRRLQDRTNDCGV